MAIYNMNYILIKDYSIFGLLYFKVFNFCGHWFGILLYETNKLFKAYVNTNKTINGILKSDDCLIRWNNSSSEI